LFVKFALLRKVLDLSIVDHHHFDSGEAEAWLVGWCYPTPSGCRHGETPHNPTDGQRHKAWSRGRR